jgi:hypothetical protein
MAESKSKATGIYFEGGQWVIDKIVHGVRLRKDTGTDDLQEAILILGRMASRIKKLEEEKRWVKVVAQLEADQASWLHRTYRKLHVRGRNSGKGCSISFTEFRYLVLASNGRCAVSGIEFSDERPAGAKAAPWGISVDRIDSSLGYHFDNIRFVCLAVNMAMREWGAEVMARIGRVMLLQELQRSEERVPANGDSARKTA